MRVKLQPLDILFSRFIRLRAMERVGGCERCLTPKIDYKQLQCSHYHSRRKASTRFNEDNAVGLCPGCHIYLTGNPLEHTEWYRKKIGEERFVLLEIQAAQIVKPDQGIVKLYLKQKLEELTRG